MNSFQTDYDGLGQVVDSKIGGTVVETNQYDNGGIADGNLTQVTDMPGCSARTDAAGKDDDLRRDALVCPLPPVAVVPASIKTMEALSGGRSDELETLPGQPAGTRVVTPFHGNVQIGYVE